MKGILATLFVLLATQLLRPSTLFAEESAKHSSLNEAIRTAAMQAGIDTLRQRFPFLSAGASPGSPSTTARESGKELDPNPMFPPDIIPMRDTLTPEDYEEMERLCLERWRQLTPEEQSQVGSTCRDFIILVKCIFDSLFWETAIEYFACMTFWNESHTKAECRIWLDECAQKRQAFRDALNRQRACLGGGPLDTGDFNEYLWAICRTFAPNPEVFPAPDSPAPDAVTPDWKADKGD